MNRFFRQLFGKSIQRKEANETLAKVQQDTRKDLKKIKVNAAVSERLVRQIQKDLTCL